MPYQMSTLPHLHVHVQRVRPGYDHRKTDDKLIK